VRYARPPRHFVRIHGEKMMLNKFREKYRLLAVLALVFALIFSAGSCALQLAPQAPVARHLQREAKGTQAMVATARPEASEAGLKILKAGGNAVDAAVAAAFAIGVVEPHASGLGGGGFMLIRTKNGEVTFLDFREKAPAAASPRMFIGADGKPFPDSFIDGRATAVPGEVAGLLLALEKFGSLNRKQVMQPAIDLAKKGYTVTKVMADITADEYGKLQACPASRQLFFKDDLPVQPGEVIVNPDLAKALELIADKGAAVFYQGDMAKKLVAAAQNAKGVITEKDLSQYRPTVGKPVRGTYRGYEIISAAPPSAGGAPLIELLNIMENFDMKKLEYGTADYWQAWIEAQKLMYADRLQFIGDPELVKMPLNGLTSKAFAKTRFAKINLKKAAPKYKAGEPWKYEKAAALEIPLAAAAEGYQSPSTTHISVADRQGNLVSFTKTLGRFYGCGLVVPGYGFVLNSSMYAFTKTPGKINSVAPLKRSRSTMAPTIVLKDGKPFASLGSPGSGRIIPAVAFVISNIVDQGMDIQQAIDAPRAYSTVGTAHLEGRIPRGVRVELEGRGQKIRVYKDYDNFFGGAQGILFYPDGVLHGGADPRRDGVALGF